MWYLQQCRYHIFCIYLLEDEFDFRAAFFRFLENLRGEYFSPHSPSVHILGVVFLFTRVRDNILKSKEQKNIQPTKGGHKMVTCQNYVSLFYCQITSCPSDGGIS